MGAFLVLVILIIGFVYTSRDLEARYKQKKSTNTESYSHMAMWGLFYWGFGGMIVCIAWLLLAIASFLVSTIVGLCVESFSVQWHSDFSSWTIADTNVPLVISLTLGLACAWARTEDSAKKMKVDPSARLDVLEKIAASDNVQLLLIEASRKSLRVMITLKSRKVYIGFIRQLAHEQAVPGDEDITIIPLVSGYRNKDDLTFLESHNYAEFYHEYQIGPTTEPLSLDHFRVVIPRAQIESISLFDPTAHKAIQRQSADGAESSASESITQTQD